VGKEIVLLTALKAQDNIREIILTDSRTSISCIPAGVCIEYNQGRSSDLLAFYRLPDTPSVGGVKISDISDKKCLIEIGEFQKPIYSCGYSSGIAPDSLLISLVEGDNLNCGAKVRF
jgi:hypothetical protein